jgi:hypothetical protein
MLVVAVLTEAAITDADEEHCMDLTRVTDPHLLPIIWLERRSGVLLTVR